MNVISYPCWDGLELNRVNNSGHWHFNQQSQEQSSDIDTILMDMGECVP